MANETAVQTPAIDLVSNRRSVALGLLAGGVLAGFLALLIKVKHADFTLLLPAILLVMALAMVGLAFVRLRRVDPAAVSEDQFRRHKRLVGLFIQACGVIQLALAIWLGYGQRLSGLGETAGLFSLALIFLACGWWQARTNPIVQETLVQALRARQAGLSLFLIALGSILVLFGVWLRFRIFSERPGALYPLWLAPLLLGLVLAGSGAFLRLNPQLSPSGARFAVLAVGGLSGLVLALMTFCLAWIWRDDVFFANVAGWNSERGWRVWLCGYLQLYSLALIFGSLLLARADIRVNPILRRTLYGYNAVLTGLLLLVFLVTLNIVVYASYPFTFDWTKEKGLYALSKQSIDVLEKLREPVTAYVIINPRSSRFSDIKHLLDNCQHVTDLLSVEYIHPDRDFERYRKLMAEYSQLGGPRELTEVGRGVLLAYGKEPERKKKSKLIPPAEIHEPDFTKRVPPGTHPPTIFNGENVIVGQIKYFMEGDKKAKVYFLQGHGELDLAVREAFPIFLTRPAYQELAPQGAGGLIERLQKEKLEVMGLSFSRPEKGKENPRILYLADKKEIPDDARAVVIAGPSRPLATETVEALKRYMTFRKGRLLVMLDVVTDREYKGLVKTGLEDFLKDFNVDVTNEYVFHYPGFRDDPLLFEARTPGNVKNLVSRSFALESFVMRTARIVNPLVTAPGFQAEVMLMGIGQRTSVIWSEANLSALKNPLAHGEAKLTTAEVQEQLPVAVAVTESDKPGGEGRPRLVVIGDAEIAANALQDPRVGSLYYSFLASCLDWLAERPGVGARQREPGIYEVSSKTNWGRLALLPGWLMSLAVIGLGTGIWVVRRR